MAPDFAAGLREYIHRRVVSTVQPLSGQRRMSRIWAGVITPVFQHTQSGESVALCSGVCVSRGFRRYFKNEIGWLACLTDYVPVGIPYFWSVGDPESDEQVRGRGS